jgi:hypothetical protein
MSPRATTPTAPVEDTATSIAEAIASARLEGVKLSAEFMADANLAADGEIDEDELVARTLARHRP